MDLCLEQRDGQWHASCGTETWRCAIGRSGVRPAEAKVEGDGATPAGCWPLRRILFRADRLAPFPSPCEPQAIQAEDGWCDDPAHPAYNQQIKRPFAASHEELWRGDALYDIIGILGHNDDPPRPGRGSAIFLHVAAPDYTPTAGCVALARPDLLRFLSLAGPGSRVCVPEPD